MNTTGPESLGSRTAQALSALRDLLGERLATDAPTRLEHGHDVSHHAARAPDAVARPASVAEAAAIVRTCAAHRIPVVPYGTGTAVEGGVVAVRGGVCIDLRGMNRIVRFSADDMDVTVEAGVTRKQLDRFLLDQGSRLHFPNDPGADASLGGMAATNASGSAAVRYGTMRDNVLGLTVILADGTVVTTGGRARKSSSGYDLTRLFVGSEGTLGLIVELVLKLTPRPEAVSAATCPFPTVEAAVSAVMRVFAEGIRLARIELLDEVQMGAVVRYSGLDCALVPTLFLEFHGTPAGVVEQTERVGRILRECGGGEFRWAVEPGARDRLWQARHDAYYASLALRPGGAGCVTDVCVPVSRLAECIGRTKELLKSTSLPAPLFGHVGDGNFHVVFSIDPHSPRELEEVRELSRRITELAWDCGGTCSGEHGIGLGKIEELERERGPAVDVMRAIKRALDPQGLFNPGKVLREERSEGGPGTGAHDADCAP